MIDVITGKQSKRKIAGLEEIEQAEMEEERYLRKREHCRSTKELESLSLPHTDIKALREKYPIADAYLRARYEFLQEDPERSAIGKKAMDAIANNSDGYAKALEQMEKEIDSFLRRHAWDD